MRKYVCNFLITYYHYPIWMRTKLDASWTVFISIKWILLCIVPSKRIMLIAQRRINQIKNFNYGKNFSVTIHLTQAKPDQTRSNLNDKQIIIIGKCWASITKHQFHDKSWKFDNHININSHKDNTRCTEWKVMQISDIARIQFNDKQVIRIIIRSRQIDLLHCLRCIHTHAYIVWIMCMV